MPHRLELGVLEAIKTEAHLATIQDMPRKVHKHYHYSPKALCELRAIADAMDEKIIKPTRLQGTRWVPHINQATKTLAQSYSVILAHFDIISRLSLRLQMKSTSCIEFLDALETANL